MRTDRARRTTSVALGAVAASWSLALDARAADVEFNPTLNASYYWDGNTEIVEPDGTTTSDRAVRLSVALPVAMRGPAWSFNTTYNVSGRLYAEREDESDLSHALSLGYNRDLSERNDVRIAATASRTEDQQVEPDAPDQPITYLPRSSRTSVSASVGGSNDVSIRSDISWSVNGSTVLYDDTSDLNYEDNESYTAAVGWAYRISEKTTSGFAYRYGRAVYDDRPDAQTHSVAWTGGTVTRKEVGVNYALGVITTDTGGDTGWKTSGGANLAARWSPRPDHSLSAGIRQDVSAGRGLGGPTLDRGVYVGWAWSRVRGLGLAVTGGYWDRAGVDDRDRGTQSLYVYESLSWGFGDHLRIGVFHAYRDQSDDGADPAEPTFDTSYHTAGFQLGWTILGARQRR